MQKAQIPSRIESIDIFRALTMLLMIFVNSLGHLSGIPDWLGHTSKDGDAMGLADIVFPFFLFIVGMSIPFAVKSRLKKGESKGKIIVHVLIRSVALLIMGVFHENISHINPQLSGISRPMWQLLVNLSFILIWNVYPDNKPKFKNVFIGLRVLGIVSLIILAALFRAGDINELIFFKPYWWGILGLIGWTYLISTIIYLYSKQSLTVITLAFLVFAAYNVLSHAGLIILPSPFNSWFSFFGRGAFASLSLGGVMASLIYIWAKENNRLQQFFIIMLSISVLMFIAGSYTRQFWGIAKLGETPAWVFFSLAAAYSSFSLLFWVTDVKGYKKIFKIVRPAGTSTLLCYIIPYLYESILELTGLALPHFFNFGIIGLIKAAIISLLIVMFTGLLERMGIKMKL